MVKHIAPGLLCISFRRVGGLRFLKIGRLTVSWSVAKAYQPLKGAAIAR